MIQLVIVRNPFDVTKREMQEVVCRDGMPLSSYVPQFILSVGAMAILDQRHTLRSGRRTHRWGLRRYRPVCRG